MKKQPYNNGIPKVELTEDEVNRMKQLLFSISLTTGKHLHQDSMSPSSAWVNMQLDLMSKFQKVMEMEIANLNTNKSRG